MDKYNELGQQISLLEEELSDRMQTLMSQGPSANLYSTPKIPVKDLSDSGIIQTRHGDFMQDTHRASIGTDRNVPRPEVPRLYGPFTTIKTDDKGARPKELTTQKTHTTKKEAGTEAMPMPDVSPILREELRQNKPVRNTNSADKPSHGKTRREIKLANYDGTSEWSDFKSHFDACAVINNWDDQEKGLYLATALRGQAQGVFSDLPTEKRMDYTTLIKALQERFSPPNQTELYRVQLKERRQKASESLPELGQAIRRLVNKAYPNAPSEVRETLAREQFLDSLVDSEMRIRIKQSRPENLNQTICLAVELEAFYKAERKYDTGRGHLRATCTEPNESYDKMAKMMEDFSTKIESLQKDLDNFKSDMTRKDSDTNMPGWKDKIQCYNCGRFGHFRNECRAPKKPYNGSNGRGNGAVRPLHYNSRHRRMERRKINVGTDASNMEAGAYIDVAVHNQPTKFLIDTGATVTLVSHALFYRIQKKERPELEPITQVIISANGTELSIAGKGMFCIEIGQDKFIVEALVADISIDGILGLDFMKENNCKIDLQQETLQCKSNTYPMAFSGKIGCYRISAAEDISIPPGTEAFARGRINDYDTLTSKLQIGIIEPSEKFVKRDNALLAKTLVEAREQVPIRLLNVSNNVTTIRAGTIVGEISPVEDVITMTENTRKEHKNPKLDNELQKLVNEASSHLTEKQRHQVTNCLQQYKSLFALSDNDLGCTSIVRHRINTGTNYPVKQPPRRTPVAMRDEIDKHIDDMLERGVIEPSEGPWSSGIVLVKKKDGSTRFCVDYRRLNDLTVKDAYPNADALSRMPCKQCGFEQDWEKKLVRVNVVTQAPPIEVNESAICTNDGSDENKTLLVLQQEDENISLIKSWVLNGKKPLFKEIGECNYAVKSLWSQYETLKVDNGLLCKEQSTGGKLRVIVPMKERRVVLQQCHDNKTSGHLGIRKTLGRLKYRFYWPGMRRDVVAYITGCETCVRRKGPQKRKRAPMQIQRSGFPMERIAVDILGELPKTANNNKYILVIADYYTKWTESFPMENMEASTVANIIVTEIICRFGVPTLIHSDQGRQFESELFSEMCNLLQISKTRTTPYHPQSDGMVERFNSTLVKNAKCVRGRASHKLGSASTLCDDGLQNSCTRNNRQHSEPYDDGKRSSYSCRYYVRTPKGSEVYSS
ncbi:unnamed protein product [Mytilus edulis]|uniref:Endonuclease n=1 Tax=Mytilus edulis TaxID=6550 RepID=A0A8S3S3U6_MYTED|nr:unnamed protein product [Mytilus edulis]